MPGCRSRTAVSEARQLGPRVGGGGWGAWKSLLLTLQEDRNKQSQFPGLPAPHLPIQLPIVQLRAQEGQWSSRQLPNLGGFSQGWGWTDFWLQASSFLTAGAGAARGSWGWDPSCWQLFPVISLFQQLQISVYVRVHVCVCLYEHVLQQKKKKR
jgi:hypothetical protein